MMLLYPTFSSGWRSTTGKSIGWQYIHWLEILSLLSPFFKFCRILVMVVKLERFLGGLNNKLNRPFYFEVFSSLFPLEYFYVKLFLFFFLGQLQIHFGLYANYGLIYIRFCDKTRQHRFHRFVFLNKKRKW